MPRLVKGNAIVEDNWQVVEADAAGEPGQPTIMPLNAWLALDEANRTSGQTAPWIDSGEEFEEAIEQLLNAPLIALNFPTFMDGRGFSAAEVLRRQYGYKGELRAIGYLMQDQLFFLKRCGFDSVQLREGTDLDAAVKSLEDFSVSYQTSADTEVPLFRKR